MHRKFPLLLATLLVAVGVLVAPDAAAQITLTINSDRPHNIGDASEIWFSRDNCTSDFTVSYQVAGVQATSQVEAWASQGVDCADPAVRNDPAQSCVQLGTVTGNETRTFVLSAQTLANAGLPDLNGCDPQSANQVSVTVALLVDPTAGAASESVTIPVIVDFKGPDAPTIDTIGPKDSNTVAVEFTPPVSSDAVNFYVYCEQAGVVVVDPGEGGAGGTATTSNTGGGNGTNGFNTYGGVGGGTGGSGGMGGMGGTATGGSATGGSATGGSATGGSATGGSGTGGAATGGSGTGGSGTGGSTSSGGVASVDDQGICADSMTLFAGEIMTIANCGTSTTSPIDTVQGTAPSGTQEGFAYWIAVAGVDNLGNVGVISEPMCSSPSEVDDFWSDYDGPAGGGICSCATVGAAHTSLAVAGWAALLLGLALRRSRKEIA